MVRCGYRFWIAVAILTVLAAADRCAAAKGVTIQALISETQIASSEPGDMTLVWWIPDEYWATGLAQDKKMTKAQIDEVIEVLHPYTLVAVVDGKIGTFGSVTYRSEHDIRAGARLVDADKKSYAPLADDKVSADARIFLQMIKPVAANMLGSMGENMHFLMFPGKSASGTRIADANTLGHFEIKLGLREFKWQLPLDSLLPAQSCPNCKRECKGSWGYCPWCGTKLIKKTETSP